MGCRPRKPGVLPVTRTLCSVHDKEWKSSLKTRALKIFFYGEWISDRNISRDFSVPLLKTDIIYKFLRELEFKSNSPSSVRSRLRIPAQNILFVASGLQTFSRSMPANEVSRSVYRPNQAQLRWFISLIALRTMKNSSAMCTIKMNWISFLFHSLLLWKRTNLWDYSFLLNLYQSLLKHIQTHAYTRRRPSWIARTLVCT